MAKPVGKLKKINLNEVWANEVDGFASWLQQEEILEMLGEALEISLKSAGGEIPLRRQGEQRCFRTLHDRSPDLYDPALLLSGSL